MSLRIVFMGSPAFALPTLEAILAAGHEVAAVYAQPPRPAGRGKKPRPQPVHTAAEAHGLAVRHPVSLKGAEAQAEFAALEADVAVVAAYGLLLPQVILDAPKHGCVNLHPSLLPRWRGAAPINRPIMAGDVETGVCVMRMTAGLDEGPVMARWSTPIGPRETTATLHDRLAAQGAKMIVEVLAEIEAGTARETRQDHAAAVYAAKIDKAEARLDFSQTAEALDRLIRGVQPQARPWLMARGEVVKVLEAEPCEAPAGGLPGEIIAPPLVVRCGDETALRLTRLQRAGKSAMDAEAFLRGFSFDRAD